MTKATEKDAEKYLLRKFKSKRYRFEKPVEEDKGFDLWLIDKTKKREKKIKAELKSTGGEYKTPADIRANLVFNHKTQVDVFRCGESVIVRVFLGSHPPKVILVSNGILGSDATIKQAPRYEFSGTLDYSVIDELT